ncbi:hypothetical protein L1N85_16280 [Paenibacillus alkaliterrae]|uniref:hypothetical protein n=1 Tax=Paenibacillus alkaliterrae TaxID=320909 RepID=UPI001F3C0F1E|nr:hypothetical protein [Paenibacillus alkaliterrae]MCF2939976.1 hypothetical protein [Paenibacillus alkaliterrae]
MDHLFFSAEQRSEWGESFKRLFPEKASEAIAEANRWCEDSSFIWKNTKIEMGTPINWRASWTCGCAFL